MGLADIFKRKISREPADDSVEFPNEEAPVERMKIRVETVNNLTDLDRVASYIKQGHVILVKVKDLQRNDVGLFQTTVQKMKRMCTQFNWDLVAIPEGYLVVTPNYVRIERPGEY